MGKEQAKCQNFTRINVYLNGEIPFNVGLCLGESQSVACDGFKTRCENPVWFIPVPKIKRPGGETDGS